MKSKDKRVLAGSTLPDLVKQSQEQKDKLAQWTVNRYTKQSHNLREGRIMSRRIAVIQTLIRQKELAHE